MGIQTWYREYRRKQQLKKALKKGRELESAGLTQVPTTSGFVETPIGSSLDVSYREGSRGGGGFGGDGGIAPFVSAPQTSPEEEIPEQVQKDIEILEKSQELKVEAEKRGYGFTRLGAERFLGGAGGVVSLRKAEARERIRKKRGLPTIKETMIMEELDPSFLSVPLQQSTIPSDFRPDFSPLDSSFGTDISLTEKHKRDLEIIPKGTIYFKETGKYKGVPTGEYLTVPFETYTSRPATKEEISLVEDVVIPREKERGFKGVVQSLEEKKAILGTKFTGKDQEIDLVGRGTLFGVSAGATLLGNIAGFGTLATSFYRDPITTAKAIPTGLGLAASEFGRTLKVGAPEQVLGRVAGEYLTFKGINILARFPTRISDVIRTRGLTKLPVEEVVAPEFFRGQTYPAIYRGETAGQLLKEFKSPKPYIDIKYGEVKLTGFTAAAKPFKAITETGRGTSELVGVYQAPKLSPQFLRIIGEETKLFSWSPFETWRPTIVKIVPTEYKLTPFVKPSQKSLVPLRPTKEFLEVAPKGKSFVPFVKTEKEAIIPYETPLELTGKRFFIKFEKRRVPIHEFDVADLGKVGKQIKPPKSKLPTAEEITRSLSSSRVGRKAKFSLSEVASSLRSRASYLRSSLRGDYSSSYRPLPRKSSYYPLKSLRSSYVRRYGKLSSGLPSYRSYRRGLGGGSSYYAPTRGTYPPIIPPKVPPILPDLEMFGKRKGLVATRAFKFTPSFGVVTAKSLGINLKGFGKGFKAQTGIFEREFRKGIKLPPVLAGKVIKYSSSKKKKKRGKK